MSTDRPTRTQAEALLTRALKLRTRHAGAWFEYALLLRKQGGDTQDSERALRRARWLAEHEPGFTPDSVLASILLEQARAGQAWLDRLRWLKDGTRISVYTPSCSDVGAFCENFTRPHAFNETLRDALPLVGDLEDRRREVLLLYQAALQRQPSLIEAFEGSLREHVIGGEWEQVAAAARDAPGDSKSSSFFAAVRGLALVKLGRFAEADSLFRSTITLLPDTLRRWYELPPPGLDTVADFWARSRPLWLTAYDELQLEYWARVTYATLVFRDRLAGVAGPETPMGDALIRYGWPTMITQVSRDGRRILGWGREFAAWYTLTCDPTDDPGKCELPGAQGAARDESGGRWLLLTYSMDRPSFIFELRQGQRVPQYMRMSAMEEYARRLREASPLTFSSSLAPRLLQLPVQVARFRGQLGSHTAVGIFAAVPTNDLEIPTGDSVSAGVFVFEDVPGMPMRAASTQRLAGAAASLLQVWLNAPAGRYHYSVEAVAAASGTAASARDSLVLRDWPRDSLLMSDLLLASRVAARSSNPLSWQDLDISPAGGHTVLAGGTVWLVWEVYGLPMAPDSVGRFEVSLTLRDVNARGLPLRLLQRLGLPTGRPAAVSLDWTTEQRLSADGRALQYVAVQLPPGTTGTHRIEVVVHDVATRRSFSRQLGLTIVEP